MSQDRRKPTQLQQTFQEKLTVTEPGEFVRLELVPIAPTKRDARSGHLEALLQLLSENGIDCSVLVDADDETPRTIH
jgi:hypothetical protein